MKIAVFSSAPTLLRNNKFEAYAPYVREMNIWFEHCDEVKICSFDNYEFGDLLLEEFKHQDRIQLVVIPEFYLISIARIIKTIALLPKVFFKTYQTMKWADHIHLRCPSSMGLVGSFVQILFPDKIKTAKYAGNWDFESKQPWSYRLQQKILKNTTLTKNMQVLVYGEWPDRNKNIKPFFTATYHESEIVESPPRDFNGPVKLIYVGALNPGKQPLASAEVCHKLLEKGISAELHFYGEGPEREKIETFIAQNNLSQVVTLHGNVDKETLQNALRASHFLVFISKSEGWPKAVAESMFWGCVPLTTKVSCVPDMVGHGERGDIVNPNPEEIAGIIEKYINNPSSYKDKSQKGMDWSRQYTLEKFESEIKLLLMR